MPTDKNFILAIGLSILVLVVWSYVFAPEFADQQLTDQAQTEVPTGDAADTGLLPSVDASRLPTIGGDLDDVRPSPRGGEPVVEMGDVVTQGPRLAIDTPALSGSIALVGARLDDLELKGYRETIEPDSPQIVLLSPQGTANPYFVEFGWRLRGRDTGVPTSRSLWTVRTSGPLTPDHPVRLEWDDGAGLKFIREIAVDENYMFTVTQIVENYGRDTAELFPYGLIQRYGTPDIQGFFILHEGFLGVINGALEEVAYDDTQEEPPYEVQSTGGWLGITDKYWMTALVPDQTQMFDGRFSENTRSAADIYQADYILGGMEVRPGEHIETVNRFFAGAKKVRIIEGYNADLGITRFDLAIDWGWLFFLTKPLFLALDYIGTLVGNFGIAILIVTVLIKLVLFPLANHSYVAMSKMKKLQPKMVQLRERYADDKAKQQQEIMALYKKEKVNPAAGCVPIIIQIPVFFSLYKVLFVTLEMRHAPFFGWIQDLSAPDPTSIFNLFGLIPWDPPSFLIIGVWPLLMGMTMFVQQKMNPPPADPIQEKVFLFMPLMFTVLLARFASGLVIYWAWNNSLSIIQQYVIMRRMGVKVELFERLKLPAFLNRASTILADNKTDGAVKKDSGKTGSDE